MELSMRFMNSVFLARVRQITTAIENSDTEPSTLRYRQVLQLADEVGEFIHAWRRWNGNSRTTGTQSQAEAELADIVITAYVSALILGLDLETALAEKLCVIEDRFGLIALNIRKEGLYPPF